MPCRRKDHRDLYPRHGKGHYRSSKPSGQAFVNLNFLLKVLAPHGKDRLRGGAEQAGFDGMLHVKTSGKLLRVCMDKTVKLLG